jgi:membrane protein YdbS with pleckstrin-like domain
MTAATESSNVKASLNLPESATDAVKIDALEADSQEPLQKYRAHWHIFVPTAIIWLLYMVGWITLYFLDMSGGSLARLFIVVLAVGVPLLFAHAFLRYQTISIEIYETHLQYHTGWPRAEPVMLPYGLISKINYSRGLSGRMFGGGTVILKLLAGEAIGIADVEKPMEATKKIRELM